MELQMVTSVLQGSDGLRQDGRRAQQAQWEGPDVEEGGRCPKEQVLLYGTRARLSCEGRSLSCILIIVGGPGKSEKEERPEKV
jgi:hypothetical protein